MPTRKLPPLPFYSPEEQRFNRRIMTICSGVAAAWGAVLGRSDVSITFNVGRPANGLPAVCDAVVCVGGGRTDLPLDGLSPLQVLDRLNNFFKVEGGWGDVRRNGKTRKNSFPA